MADKIKIVLRQNQPVQTTVEKIKLKPKQEEFRPIQIDKSTESRADFSQPEKTSSLEDHIKKYFIKPLNKLIKNDGVNNGVLIASVDALEVIAEMIDSIIEKRDVSIIDILESAAFAGQEEEVEEVVEASFQEEAVEEQELDDELEEEEDNDDDEDEEEDEEEEDYEEYDDLEEARECDSYAGYEEDESMDG